MLLIRQAFWWSLYYLWIVLVLLEIYPCVYAR
jgi:hypothetical protein